MSEMSFQPLTVVILLIFLVLLSFALFVWFLLSMGQAPRLKSESLKQKEQTENPALRSRKKQLRRTEPAPRKIEQLSTKQILKNPNLEQNAKTPPLEATIPRYKELRPISKNRHLKTAESAKERLNTIKAESNDGYRGLNSTKAQTPKDKIDPFDSFVEANKKNN